MHFPMTLPTRRRTVRHAASLPAATSRVHPLRPADLRAPAPLVLTDAVFENIRSTVGSEPAETGGPLGGTRGSGVADSYHFDGGANTTPVIYRPDVNSLNAMFKIQWNPTGTNLLGFAHSHPAGNRRPSHGDLAYAKDILAAIPELDRLVLPVVQSAADTATFSIAGFAARRDLAAGMQLDDIDVMVLPAAARAPEDTPELQRVLAAYDPAVMASTRVLAVGCGGSASFLEDMARAGCAEFVLIDPDIVEAPNVGTQQTYLSDIGRLKVESIAERLIDISSRVRVWTVAARLDDLDDAAMRRLALGWLPSPTASSPAATVLCAFTDDFFVQARVNRLGLHLGLPVIGAVVYREGRGVEVTFSAPGVTSACIRCALASRYRSYLNKGYVNDVTSHGTPISATARLNALKLPIVLGMLHTVSPRADVGHPATIRHRRFLDSIQDRNLVVASLDPDIDTTLGVSLFRATTADPSGRLAVDTTLWLKQEPDAAAFGREQCPDCGGSGDLSQSTNQFIDTTPMPLTFGDYRC